MLMKNVNGIDMPLDEADLAQRQADAQMVAARQVPQPVTVWQFMTAARRLGFITHAEALTAIRDKVMPAPFAVALAELPPEAQEEAQLKFAGITTMVRTDPLFNLLVEANVVTDAQIDNVFTVAATIT